MSSVENSLAAQLTVGPARRRGLAEEVADRIRAAIFAGAHPPGAQLREVELAAELDVSRGPVREALGRLEREGLVQIRWHRGANVTTLSAQDAEELYTLRSVLERLAVDRVVAVASPADFDAFDAVVDRMERAATDHELLQLDLEFHDRVYTAALHQRLHDAWQAIRSQVTLFLLTRIDVSDDYRTSVPAEHRALVTCLRTRDAARSTRLFADHLAEAYNRLVRDL